MRGCARSRARRWRAWRRHQLSRPLVSLTTGFKHDLRALCELAHSRGALIYADIIQAAGNIPVDVRESQVDFAACSTYKWLMGDFGAGFLYVREEHLERLRPDLWVSADRLRN